MILEALEVELHTSKTEKVKIERKLTIEHLLPKEWERHWPFPEDGVGDAEERTVPWYWIVDPDARTIDVYRLQGDAYGLEARLDGPDPRALPPFPNLPLDPAAIWP